MNVSFQGEVRTLSQGQTYRIYLDDPGASDGSAAGSAAKATTGADKVAYFIVGAGVAGATAWGYSRGAEVRKYSDQSR